MPRKNQYKQRLSLSPLQVTQPIKVDDGWEVKVVATVLYGSRAPDPSRDIVFALDGVEYTRDRSDADSGMVKAVMTVREIGEHVITVFVSDFLSARQQHRFTIKEEKKLKREVKVLHIYRRLSRLEVVLQRIGKNGKPEQGEISVQDFEQGGIVFSDKIGDSPSQIKNWGIVVVFLPYFEYPRQVTFFLPDDTDVKMPVDVPAREKSTTLPEPKPALISPFQKGREAAQRLFGRTVGKLTEVNHV